MGLILTINWLKKKKKKKESHMNISRPSDSWPHSPRPDRGRRQVTLLWKPQLKIQAYPDTPIIMSWLASSKWFCLPKKNTNNMHTQTCKPDRCSWEGQILRDYFVILFPKCAQRVSEWLSASTGTHGAKSGLEVGHWFKPVQQSSHTFPSSTFKMPFRGYIYLAWTAWTGAGLSS